VVDAVVAEIAVVDAYGNMEASDVEVEIKYEARTKSSNDPMPATESLQFGVVVPIPTLDAK
jgi:hypothetical protein